MTNDTCVLYIKYKINIFRYHVISLLYEQAINGKKINTAYCYCSFIKDVEHWYTPCGHHFGYFLSSKKIYHGLIYGLYKRPWSDS